MCNDIFSSRHIEGFKYNENFSGIDPYTESTATIDYVHHEIHDGHHFNYCDYDISPLGASAKIEFVFITPNTSVWVHFVFEVFSSTGATIELFAEASDVVGGTAITPRNNNRNSTNTSGVTLLRDPTSITDGTRAAGFLAGANRAGGFVERSREFILKQNTTYLIRITSLASSNNISWCGEWYEAAAKN